MLIVLCAPDSLLYYLYFRELIHDGPTKQDGKLGEKKDLTKEERAAEADYQRLVASAVQQEGKERYWEQEVSRLGGMASRARRRSTQQENQVRDVKVTLDRAKKAME